MEVSERADGGYAGGWSLINDVSITIEGNLYYACTVYANLYYFGSDISKLIKLSRERK